MIIRQTDDAGDWTFGKGKNNYLSRIRAIEQNIGSRLRAVLGDAFFDLNAGIDWLNLLGGKDRNAINLRVGAVILNTPNVTGIKQLQIVVDQRRLTIKYQAQTTYGTAADQFKYDLNAIG